VLEGRLQQTAEEIALGTAMLDAAGAQIGSLVTLAGERGDDVDLKVVGTVVLPAGEDTAGVSSVVTRDGLERLRRSDGYSDVFVRFADGADPEAALADLPEGRDVFFAEQPTSVKNLVPVRSTPRALAMFLAVLALAAAGHGLATAVRRRRRDLAVLRALGFRRNQVSVVIASHATVIALVGAAVGIPLGAVLGRLVLTEFAAGARVVPAPATPIAVFGACVLGAVVLVNVIALGPAWYARLAAVAGALSAE
jgi:ABC-type lipoprotein release transport system permease subunit